MQASLKNEIRFKCTWLIALILLIHHNISVVEAFQAPVQIGQKLRHSMGVDQIDNGCHRQWLQLEEEVDTLISHLGIQDPFGVKVDQ